MLRHLANIYRLGVKELWSLWRDPMMLFLIVYMFTVAVYADAHSKPESLHRAAAEGLGVVAADPAVG